MDWIKIILYITIINIIRILQYAKSSIYVAYFFGVWGYPIKKRDPQKKMWVSPKNMVYATKILINKNKIGLFHKYDN